MKIIEINGKDRDELARYTLKVNDKEVLSAGCLSECPEDAMLERDLNFVYDIVDLMKQAYEAGKNGEEFILEQEEEKED